MAVHLLPHQAQALEWLKALAGRGLGGVLCDEAGTGKVVLFCLLFTPPRYTSCLPKDLWEPVVATKTRHTGHTRRRRKN